MDRRTEELFPPWTDDAASCEATGTLLLISMPMATTISTRIGSGERRDRARRSVAPRSAVSQ